MILHSKKPSARRAPRPRLFPMRPDRSPHYRRHHQTVATHSEPLFRVDLLTFISLPFYYLRNYNMTKPQPTTTNNSPVSLYSLSKGLIRPSETFGSNFD